MGHGVLVCVFKGSNVPNFLRHIVINEDIHACLAEAVAVEDILAIEIIRHAAVAD
jgi:hypothetical protein